MGEIMRWRLTRVAQRRVPANTSLLQLGGPYSITSPTLNSLVQDFQQTGMARNDPTFVTHSSILANLQALRGYLSKPARGAATPRHSYSRVRRTAPIGSMACWHCSCTSHPSPVYDTCCSGSY